MNKCRECKKDFVYDRAKGHRKDLCNTCKTNLRNRKKKLDLITIAGSKCVKCGYSKCQQVLQFHHVDPKTKSFNISGGYNRSMDALKEEIAKCILVCANCHIEIHSSLTQSG